MAVNTDMGGRISVHDRLGGRTMLCDPAGGRISGDERVERLLMLGYQMNTHTEEIRRENLFMTTLISLDGAREV